MTDRTTAAYSIRKAMTDEHRKFEEELGPDQEAVMTVFMPGREIQLRVGRIDSSDASLISISGEDTEGKPIKLMMFYSSVAYMLEAVSTAKPKRFGFIPETNEAQASTTVRSDDTEQMTE